jgi:hypothetical protein
VVQRNNETASEYGDSRSILHRLRGQPALPSFVGIKPPSGISPAMEKAPADKAKFVETLKASFAHIRQMVANLPDADLDKQTKVFGQDMTYRGMSFFSANHLLEHLQSIASARTNQAKPPWSKKAD